MMVNNQAKIEDIMKLWLEYQQTRKVETREKLIERYLPLVKLVASRIAISLPQYVDKDDLISNGFFGLLDAIEKYDPMRAIKFETYAVVRIRGSMLDAIRAQDWVPTSVRQKAKQYEQTVSQLENKLCRVATDNEIAQALNITLNELYTLLNQLNACTIVPLEEFIKTETSSSHLANPSEQIEVEEVKQALARAIDKLPEKERLVVTLYYYEGLTLKEISLIMKLSEARISQLHTKSIFRLRGALSRIKSSFI
ncbi:FliA/WhiG family RNA polymerase sigma factor [Pelosinus sp. UFO1]|uniref:FliA/WhiG family RNA polymerase sigma factor n=1 Tax=Pelosinus sp. UFO1 TaxID=484770 RepID=UPI0004D1F27F|nr:FliA/WhiG family RNA polymerase sigma factor [Pelosinus sp. UFO1]AIF52098.1 RNA polymerase, sigma 28 subunit, FliA/WhiG [Pelosinus sp. UFO1]